jgi:hypothetical protein
MLIPVSMLCLAFVFALLSLACVSCQNPPFPIPVLLVIYVASDISLISSDSTVLFNGFPMASTVLRGEPAPQVNLD